MPLAGLAQSATVPYSAAMIFVPSGPRLPAILQLLNWIYRPIPFMEECARRYGDCFTIHFPGNPPIVFFSDPEAVKEIFTGNPEQLPAGETRAILRPLVGQHSVLLLDGARHMHQRRLMMPPFHGERMQAYGEVMREITDHVSESWPVGRPFPLQPQMQGITLEVILRTVFGIDEGADLMRLRDRLTELLSLGANPLTLIPWLQGILGPFTGRRRMMQLMHEVDEILFAQITQRRAAGCTGREDVLAMLIEARDEAGQPMSDLELRDEMITLLVAGHETTATSLAWAFHLILQHPKVLEKLRAELRQVVGSGPVAPQHVAKLEYLDATIKETQRLNPILPLVGRRIHEPMRLGKRDLPAGVVVAPCIYLTHHRPDLWPDPDRFDPDRFLSKRPSPYEFFPFGGGIRHCLGAAFALYEMKTVLAQVLSRVVLRPAPGRTVRVVRRGITFAPSAGMPVVLESRAA
jgi:cytochrome P450